MKILLVNPGKNQEKTKIEQLESSHLRERIGNNIYNCPNPALYYLSSFFSEDDSWLICDETLGDILPDLSIFDLILVTAVTVQCKRAQEIGEIAGNANVYSCVGGIHATVRPEDFTYFYNTVFTGEADHTFEKFLVDFRNNSPARKYKQEKLSELENIRSVNYSEIEKDRYDFIPLPLSRGCENNCHYCASTNIYGNRMRIPSIDKVRKELDEIKKYHGNTLIYITDDNFLRTRDFAMKVIEEFRERNMKFICYGDVNSIFDDDLIEALQTVCSRLLVGIDSLNIKNLREYAPGKNRNIEEYCSRVQYIQKKGIGINASFMAGFDNDTSESFEEIAEFVEKSLVSEICLSIVVPLPGTSLNKKLFEENRILHSDFVLYDGGHLVFKAEHLSEDEIIEGFKMIMNRYFSKELMVRRTSFFKKVYGDRVK